MVRLPVVVVFFTKPVPRVARLTLLLPSVSVAELLTPEPPRAAANIPEEILPAFVVSVEQLAAPFDKSAQAGCVEDGTPEVEMVFIH